MNVIYLRTTYERWLSKRELAAHLGYSTRWIELKMHEGLPSRMVGSRRRYRLTDVQSWLEGRAR